MIRQLIDSGQSHLHTLDIKNLYLIESKSRDTCFFQGLDGIGVTLISIIFAVIVRQIGGFHRTAGEDSRIFGRTFKSISLILPLIGFCQCSFHIYYGEIVCFQDRPYILKEVIRTVHVVEGIQTGGSCKVGVGSQRAVADRADRQRNRFIC